MHLDDALATARSLLAEHGLHDWTVRLDRAKRRAGVCHYQRRVIGLSAPLTGLHDPAEVRQTVLHEIAHALVGPRHGHDAVWRSVATRIGSDGERCLAADVPRVAAPWVGHCPAGHTLERHRVPTQVQSCRRCGTIFDLAHLVSWTFHGRTVAMHPNYVAELDALREGRRATLLPVGSRVWVLAAGRYHGREGVVRRVARTRYRVQVSEGLLSVPFAGVAPAGTYAAAPDR